MRVPIGKADDAMGEGGFLIEPFEDSDVGIVALFILVDARVGAAGEHFVEAGVGEFFAIGDGGDAALFGVAVDLPALCDSAPEEREQGFPACFWRVTQKGGSEQINVAIVDAAVLLVDQQIFRAGKNFLPAKAVYGDEEKVFSLVRGFGSQELECEEI